MTTITLRLTFAVLTLSTSAAIAVRAQSTNWPLSGFDIRNSRWNSVESVLSVSNAHSLANAWAFATQNDVSATPGVDLLTNGVYFPDWSGNIYKLNISSGAVIWSHTMVDYGFPAGFISRTTPTLSGDTVIIGASAPFAQPNYGEGAYLAALDSTTGNLLWKQEIDATELAIVTGSPMVNDGVIYIGVSSAQEVLASPTFRGSVVAVSLATGQILWQTYMVPPGYSGGPIWSSSPALDLTRNQIYVTTGNNYSVPESVQACEVAAGNNPVAVLACQDPTNYEDSVVALDLTTGAIKWGARCSDTDAWTGLCFEGADSCPTPVGPDFDFGAGANFFTTSIGGIATDLVGAGQKSGVYWALNPSTGAVVWKQTVGPGGYLGGIEWGTATDNQRVYVAISNSHRRSYVLQPSGTPWSGGSWAALNAATGEIVWQVPDPGLDPIKIGKPSMALGPVTVANGVLYCADTAGLMFALDAGSGNTLWTFQAAGSVNAAPAVMNGMLFWGSGYHNFPATQPLGTASNEFYSFSLPGPALTTTQLTSSLDPSISGQSVTLTAAVSLVSATGTVTFSNGASLIGTGTVNNGVASLTLSTVPVGSNALTAGYSGDNNNASSISAVLTQTVNPVINGTTTTLAVSPNPSPVGQAVLLSATVFPSTATGTVSFSDGGATIGTAALSNGVAAWQTTFAVGSHNLAASYSGDGNDSGSVSTGVNEVVNPVLARTTTALTVAPNPAIYGQSVTLTATVSPSSATGLVTFYGGSVLGSAFVTNGTATLTTIALPAGTRFLLAYYGGDALGSTSASPGVNVTVNAVAASGFQPAVNQSAGGNPQAIVSSDFNGDGKLDLAVVTSGANISVLLGNGDGTFQGPAGFSATSPASVAVGDFNGDGRVDLVAANNDQGVAVLLGNGDGTFQTAVNVPAGTGASTVAVGDFNGDGRADLVVTNGTDAQIGVLLGNGDGTFQTPTFFQTENNPSFIAVGSFSRDSKTDIAVANTADNSFSIFIGNGDGTFRQAVTYAAGVGPSALARGDFNGDGKADVVVTNQVDGTVSVFLGNGDGTFRRALTYSAGSQPDSVAVGDFNGDGNADLSVANYTSDGGGSVTVLLGNGDGTFQTPSTYPGGANPSYLLAGDFNGDGRTDLAVADAGADNLSILLGKAPLVFTATTLASSLNPSTAGQSVTLTATVTPLSATGTVTFMDGWTIVGTGSIDSGVATFVTSSLLPGGHSLTAVYSGDSNNSTSTSSVVVQTVNPAANVTATTLTTTPNPSIAGQMVTLTATILPSTATGVVTFLDGGVTIGAGNISQGVATISVALEAGSHSLSALYGGDAGDTSSSSNVVTEAVN
jgi:polyvinyl alcohol dehydrogenase (cytochrome)